MIYTQRQIKSIFTTNSIAMYVRLERRGMPRDNASLRLLLYFSFANRFFKTQSCSYQQRTYSNYHKNKKNSPRGTDVEYNL